MSGPKHGEYTLSAEERARQEAKRQKRLEIERKRMQEQERKRKIEEERKRQEEEKACGRFETLIKDAQKELYQNQQVVQQFQSDMEKRYQELFGNTNNLQKFVHARQELMQKINNIPQNHGPRESKNMAAYLECLRVHIDSTRLERHPHIAELAEVCIREADLQEYANAELNYYEVIKNVKQKIIRYDLSRKPSTKPAADDPAYERLKQTMDEFHAMIDPLMEALPNEKPGEKSAQKELVELSQFVDSLFVNKEFDTEYKLSQIKMRLKGLSIQKEKYLNIITQREKQNHRLAELSTEHAALCSMLGHHPVPGYKDITDSAELEKHNSELLKALRIMEEQDYIAKSLNEVMQEMGHKVVAEEIMETPKGERHHAVYSMNEHTGINVYHSPGGAVMFEVSGYAGPDDQITELDRLRVKESMEDFCTEYEALKDTLYERGIKVANEQRKPPHEKYARFINISTINQKGKLNHSKSVSKHEIRHMVRE